MRAGVGEHGSVRGFERPEFENAATLEAPEAFDRPGDARIAESGNLTRLESKFAGEMATPSGNEIYGVLVRRHPLFIAGKQFVLLAAIE